jgi:hypothetical protein
VGNGADVLPYALSGVVAILTAMLTHRRASRAHKNTVVIDQQTLINATYEKVLSIVNAELLRQTQMHLAEREEWSRTEAALNARIDLMKAEILGLEAKIAGLEQREGTH